MCSGNNPCGFKKQVSSEDVYYDGSVITVAGITQGDKLTDIIQKLQPRVTVPVWDSVGASFGEIITEVVKRSLNTGIILVRNEDVPSIVFTLTVRVYGTGVLTFNTASKVNEFITLWEITENTTLGYTDYDFKISGLGTGEEFLLIFNINYA